MTEHTVRSLSLNAKLNFAEYLFVNGLSLRKIGQKLDLDRGQQVSNFLKKKGYKIMGRGNSAYNRNDLFEGLEKIWLVKGGSIKALCKEYQTTPVSFTNFLRARGHVIKPHRNAGNQELREKKLAEAEKLFNQGYFVYQAARIVKINNALLSDYLKEKGYDPSSKIRIPLADETIFSKIDTEEKAYWLGFLYADGAISYDGIRYCVDLALKESDYNHLAKFKKFLQTDAEIKKKVIKGDNGKKHLACRISVHNKCLVGDLVAKGCMPNKSLTLEFPEYSIVPKYLIIPFIRGYFDGDGSIYIPKAKENSRRTGQAAISFVGTKKFLLRIREELGLSNTKLYSKGKAFQSTHGGNRNVKAFLEQIYHNATIYLDRKFLKYQEFNK
jgi:hypothetical protein